MDSSLHEVWQAAAGSPFLPTIGKGSQFLVGFTLLLIGTILTAYFALSKLHIALNVVKETQVLTRTRPQLRQRCRPGCASRYYHCVRSTLEYLTLQLSINES